MKYKITPSDEQRLEQFVRSNYYELFTRILSDRRDLINRNFKAVMPDTFQQLQGRALELDDLMTILKVKEED